MLEPDRAPEADEFKIVTEQDAQALGTGQAAPQGLQDGGAGPDPLHLPEVYIAMALAPRAFLCGPDYRGLDLPHVGAGFAGQLELQDIRHAVTVMWEGPEIWNDI